MSAVKQMCLPATLLDHQSLECKSCRAQFTTWHVLPALQMWQCRCHTGAGRTFGEELQGEFSRVAVQTACLHVCNLDAAERMTFCR